MSASPARRAAFEIVQRVFEDDAYADRAFRGRGGRGLDARDRALAQRLAYGTVQRVRDARPRDRDARRAARSRKLDPPVRAALRLGAYQLAYSEVARTRPSTSRSSSSAAARLERAVPFTNAVAAAARARAARARSTAFRNDARRGRAEALVPGLGRRDLVARLRADEERSR